MVLWSGSLHWKNMSLSISRRAKLKVAELSGDRLMRGERDIDLPMRLRLLVRAGTADTKLVYARRRKGTTYETWREISLVNEKQKVEMSVEGNNAWQAFSHWIQRNGSPGP